MNIRLKPEHCLAMERAAFEYRAAFDNLAFLLDGAGSEYLNSEDFEKRYMDCVYKQLQYDNLQQEVAYVVTGSRRTGIHFSMNYQIAIIPDGAVLTDEYKNYKDETITRLQVFQDLIMQYYPEKANNGGEKRVLSRTVTFQVTDKCNLACTYCYQINKGTRRMRLEDAKLYVDKLLSGEDGFADYINPKISPGIIIEFIGGEPLLEIDLIDAIVDYFQEKCLVLEHPWATMFCISICSNGVLYDDPKVQRFLQKHRNHVSFSVTLDGNKELHDACRVFPEGGGSFDLAYHATTDWMSRGYYMGSKITISPENLGYLYEALMFFTGMGYSDINANCIYEADWTEEQGGVLYRELCRYADFLLADEEYRHLNFSMFIDSIGHPKSETDLENWCGGTGDMLSMDPDGDLYPCIRYMESSLGEDRPPMCIGNVHEGLATCTEHKNCVECLQAITRRSQSTDDCFYCPIADGCSWCSAYNYQSFGTADRRVVKICPMHKGRVLANVYYWNKFYQKYEMDRHFDLWVPKQWAVPIIGEEEYEKLVTLVKENGGYVNDEEERVYNYGENN